MDLAGNIDIRAPHDRVAAAIREPEMLRPMIPGCVSVDPVSATEFAARIEKEVGPVTLKLTAQVIVEPPELSSTYRMQVAGKSMIAGSVRVSVDIVLTPRQDVTNLAYSGTLEATGLSSRLLKGREADLMNRTNAMFLRLKGEIENPAAATGV